MLTKVMGGVLPQSILEPIATQPHLPGPSQKHVVAWLSRGGSLGHLKNLSAALVKGQAMSSVA
jgi:hypothetical protein